MIYIGAILLIQLACVAHCLLRGRHKGWICLIVFAPLIGSAVYLFVEVWSPTRPQPLPDPAGLADPLRYRPRAEQPRPKQGLLALVPKPAAERDDAPDTLYQQAEAAFGQGEHARALELLNRLRATAEVFSPEARLLLARSYEAAGQAERAEAAYTQAIKAQGSFESLEARARFARFCQAQGQPERAAALYAEIRTAAEAMPELSHKRNRSWIEQASLYAASALPPESPASPAQVCDAEAPAEASGTGSDTSLLRDTGLRRDTGNSREIKPGHQDPAGPR